MKIFCVEGTLVATARIGGLELHRLLVVVDRKGGKQVAVDPVGCKPGDWVIACGSSAAREAAGHKDYPSDLTIVGIIDYWDEERPGERPGEESPGEEPSEEPELLIVESATASADANGKA
ncbi:MAG TPA: EutN/CcmL family microcompartment protein [Acidimicrobiales bacterium]|jgi:ethanolamine utilization protein EutN|nr:EutN/CcmL family microcompartment protein [Acidimicrobiales bacterium]